MSKKCVFGLLLVGFAVVQAMSAPPWPQKIIRPRAVLPRVNTVKIATTPRGYVPLYQPKNLFLQKPVLDVFIPKFSTPLNSLSNSQFKFLNMDWEKALPLTQRVVQQTWAVQRNMARDKFPGKIQIDAVIFDMDGTLLDSLSAWEHAAARYLKTRGIDLPAEMEQHIKKISLLEGAQYLKENLSLPETPEELLEGTLALVRHQYLNDVEAKAGARQLLSSLYAQGIKISVATASDKELAMQAFGRLGLLPYINFIITCDEVGIGKMSPNVYEAALKRLGTDRARTLVVEDALYALQTAKKAGFLTAGVAEPFHTRLHEEEVRKTGDYFFESLEASLK